MLKILCTSLIALFLAAPVIAQQAPAPPVIVTMGEGVVKKAPDRAVVTLTAEHHARTPQEAQRANADATAAVITKVKAAGISADAIQTIGYNLQPEFSYANGKQTLRGYVAKNSLQVRVDALAKLGDVISAAVATGATNVSNVRLDLKDRDTVEREALRLAVQDARRRADAAASGAGVSIERVMRIEEQRDGADTMRQLAMAMPSMAETVTVTGAGAPVPIESGEIEIRSRVTMTVAIR